MQIYGSYEPTKHDQIILEAVDRKTPESYKLATRDWIRSALAEMKAMKERDRAVVSGMISKNQSGVLFVGLWHKDSILGMLKNECLKTPGIHRPISHSSPGVR